MTREEAAKEIKKTIEQLSVYMPHDDDWVVALTLAISDLRTQQTHIKLDRSRWVGCKECVPSWCKTCIRYDVRNMDTICTCSCINHSKHKPNNFCQSCGRPLTEEAWAELERRIGGNDGTTD